jgi:hypothetical protein
MSTGSNKNPLGKAVGFLFVRLTSAKPGGRPDLFYLSKSLNHFVTSGNAGTKMPDTGSGSAAARVARAAIFLLCCCCCAQNQSPPVGQTITLKSKATNLFVTAWGFEPCVDVRSSAYAVETRAEFDVIDAGRGLIALRSHSNNTYWTSKGRGPDIKIVSSSPDTSAWTKFVWIQNTDGTISLKAKNGKFVSVVESDTMLVPVIDSALLRYSENLKKSPGYDSNQSSRPVITPEMQKPFMYRAFYLRASGSTIGRNEKFAIDVFTGRK